MYTPHEVPYCDWRFLRARCPADGDVFDYCFSSPADRPFRIRESDAKDSDPLDQGLVDLLDDSSDMDAHARRPLRRCRGPESLAKGDAGATSTVAGTWRSKQLK